MNERDEHPREAQINGIYKAQDGSLNNNFEPGEHNIFFRAISTISGFIIVGINVIDIHWAGKLPIIWVNTMQLTPKSSTFDYKRKSGCTIKHYKSSSTFQIE